MRETVRRTLGGIGRTLIATGILILAFVAYELWGTGWFTAREQAHLKSQFREQIQAQLHATTTTAPHPSTTAGGGTVPPSTPSTTAPAQPVDDKQIAALIAKVHEGDPIGIIHMPWSDYAVVQGTSREDLKKGPGHYLDTPYPGQYGNAAIAGHRTTFLHPFFDLDSLKVGDTFTIDMLWGKYTYRVATPPTPVKPTDAYVARTGTATQTDPNRPDTRPSSQPWLTLTTCNPKWSASQRLIVQARLVIAKSPPPVRYVPPKQPAQAPGSSKATGSGNLAAETNLRDGLEGDPNSKAPAILWGALVALLGALWWWVYRHWRHPLTWLAGFAGFLPVLIGFYVYLERVLPAGY
jgi:sortase A